MAQSRVTREVDALCRSGRTHQRESVLPWVYTAAEAGAEAEAEAGALPSRLVAARLTGRPSSRTSRCSGGELAYLRGLGSGGGL